MAMIDGWGILEKYLDKRINLEIKLIELFILTISAQIIIVSLSEYKTIAVSVLINILATCYLVVLLIFDLIKKKSEKTSKELKEIAFTVSVPFGWKDLTPLILYIFSIVIMAITILIPVIPKE